MRWLKAIPDDMTWDTLEKLFIIEMLRREKGNRTRAAKRMEMSVRTIRNKIAKMTDYRVPKPRQ